MIGHLGRIQVSLGQGNVEFPAEARVVWERGGWVGYFGPMMMVVPFPNFSSRMVSCDLTNLFHDEDDVGVLRTGIRGGELHRLDENLQVKLLLEMLD